MFGAWWYDLLFLLAVALFASVPAVAWWEDRQDERDQEAWDRIHRPDLRERAR